MPVTDLDLLIDAARRAGEIALQYSERGARNWEKEDGTGPVTEADLAVNAMLEDKLRSARPDYGWLSEESTDTAARLRKERVFIVDPIDGTRSYIEGSGTWAHSLAITENGRVTAAAIFLPKRELLFTAALGEGAHLNDAPIRVATKNALSDANILATKPSMDARHWTDGRAPRFERHHRPSLAYRLSLVAQGSFDGMITLRASWEWDIAAGALIITEAGGAITDRTGADLVFNGAHPQLNGIVAGSKNVQRSLLDQLATA